MTDGAPDQEVTETGAACLTVGGRPEELSARYCLRWVDRPGAGPGPVLYRDGKRVVQAWSLTLQVCQGPDPCGGNANTE
jgi:hypothetical protein